MSAYLAILAGVLLLLSMAGLPWWLGVPGAVVCLGLSYWLTPKNQYVARYK